MDIMYSFPDKACDDVPASNVTCPQVHVHVKCFDSCYRPYCLQAVNSSRCCQFTVPSGNVGVVEGFAAVISANNTDVSSIYT